MSIFYYKLRSFELLAAAFFIAFLNYYSLISEESLTSSPEASTKMVLVSVAPYVHFVEKLCSDKASVILLVPPGASAHTYEPKARQMVEIARAQLWFCIGEPFEDKLQKALVKTNPSIQIVNLSRNVDLIYEHHHGHGHSCEHIDSGYDPHFWLSPQAMQRQLLAMAQHLKQVFPDLSADIDLNLELIQKELSDLDQSIRHILGSLHNRRMFVSHPAYGYLCKDYDLKQISIEFDGKDPTPKQIENIVKQAKKYQIQTIFTQPQYPIKAAQVIAKMTGAKLEELDPYSMDYFNNLRKIATAISQQGSVTIQQDTLHDAQ